MCFECNWPMPGMVNVHPLPTIDDIAFLNSKEASVPEKTAYGLFKAGATFPIRFSIDNRDWQAEFSWKQLRNGDTIPTVRTVRVA